MADYLTDAQNDIQIYFETHEIPKYFYQCLFGELVKIWGVEFIIPDSDYDAEYDDDGNIIPSDDDYSYKDQIDYYATMLSGTAGWGVAFKESCMQCNLLWLDEYYRQIDWIRSDIFDGYIVEGMLNTLFVENVKSDSYYLFKMNKENK